MCVPPFRTCIQHSCFGLKMEYIPSSESLEQPLWSSGQSSWLQIQRSVFDSRHYQMFWKVVGLERGPLSLVSTAEELLERKSCDSNPESREYSCRDPLHWPRGTLYRQTLALTSPTSGCRLVDIVRSYESLPTFRRKMLLALMFKIEALYSSKTLASP
jgi:hypothetical protein